MSFALTRFLDHIPDHMPDLVLEHVNELEHIVSLHHVHHLDLDQVLIHSYVL